MTLWVCADSRDLLYRYRYCAYHIKPAGVSINTSSIETVRESLKILLTPMLVICYLGSGLKSCGQGGWVVVWLRTAHGYTALVVRTLDGTVITILGRYAPIIGRGRPVLRRQIMDAGEVLSRLLSAVSFHNRKFSQKANTAFQDLVAYHCSNSGRQREVAPHYSHHTTATPLKRRTNL